MAQILVRNIEDDVKEALRARAKTHGRSLEEEVRDILRQAIAPANQFGLGSQIMALFRDCPMPEMKEIHGTSRPVLDFSGPEWGPPDDEP